MKIILHVCMLFPLLGCLSCFKSSNVDHQVSPVEEPDSQNRTMDESPVASDSCISKKTKHPGLRVCISRVANEKEGRVFLQMTVINDEGPPLEFCKFQTPFESGDRLTGNGFQVVDSKGKEAEYRGVMIKRAPPSRHNGDYITVESGKPVRIEFDLANS